MNRVLRIFSLTGCWTLLFIPISLMTTSAQTQQKDLPRPEPGDTGQAENALNHDVSTGNGSGALAAQGALAVKQQEDAQLADALHIPTPAERARKHAIFFPEFQKNFRTFAQLGDKMVQLSRTQTMDAATEKKIRENSKELEKKTSEILAYTLDGLEPPKMPEIDPSVATVQRRMTMILQLFGPVVNDLGQMTPNPIVIDAPEHTVLLNRLQLIKELSWQLSK